MTRTPDEIKKGLEWCMAAACGTLKKVDCPYSGIYQCHDRVLHDALILIQQFEAQNVALSESIKWMEAERDDLKRTIQQLQAERDAAVAELKDNRICQKCEHFDAGWNEPCLHCDDENNRFEWRGVQKEE